MSYSSRNPHQFGHMSTKNRRNLKLHGNGWAVVAFYIYKYIFLYIYLSRFLLGTRAMISGKVSSCSIGKLHIYSFNEHIIYI